MPTLKTASTRRAKRRDKLARWVITLGGVTVIASVIAILALIVGVTVPLFRTPRANVVCVCPLPAARRRHAPSRRPKRVCGLGIDWSMRRQPSVTGFVWTDERDALRGWTCGPASCWDKIACLRPAATRKARFASVEPLGAGKYSLSWSDGAASLVEIVAQRADRKDANAARYAVRSLATFPHRCRMRSRDQWPRLMTRRSAAAS